MLNVYLLRHGQTSWNAEGNKYCGRTDIPLTALGIRQAEHARELLKGIALEKIYASPLERARHTAEIAGSGRPVICDERLIEVDFGNWEGKTRAEFIEEHPALWEAWSHDPLHNPAGGNGETAGQVIRRVDDFFNAALALHGRAQQVVSGNDTSAQDDRSGNTSPAEKNILVVGHNGINRLYMAWKLGMHLKDYRRIVQENSSVTLFSLDEQDGFSLKKLNSH